MFKSVMMVCIGNVCRSPYAEGLLRAHFEQHYPHYHVSSAGVGALVGEPASQSSIDLMSTEGIDISAHRARQVSQELLAEPDLILAMAEDQIQYLQHKYPFVSGKVFLLGKFQELDIVDPYRKPFDAYEHMGKQIHLCLADWIARFWPPQKTETNGAATETVGEAY